MFKDLKAFILRGNVMDLAIAVVVGTAFGAVINAFVTDLLTPLITIPGKVNFASLTATVHHSIFRYGAFLNAVISFLIISIALFFAIVRPVNYLMARRQKTPEETTRPCPECLSVIPIAAHRCAFCTAIVEPLETLSA